MSHPKAEIEILRDVSFYGIETYTYVAKYGGCSRAFEHRYLANHWLENKHIEFLIQDLTSDPRLINFTKS